ncbi:MAG: 4a-hydroxytetrahydrobiopterin dehydratase [Armatimonadota bacterium]
MQLADQQCEPVRAGASPMSKDKAEELVSQVPGWVLEGDGLRWETRFKDFRAALDFVLKVADIAEEQDHHPDIAISYSLVRLTLTTHKVGGLTLNDFIMAAKINRLVGAQRESR